MKMKKFCRAFALAMIAFAVSAADASEHSNKMVGHVLPPDSRPCTFFTLKGVTVADSIVTSGWFAVPMSYQGYKEIYSLLLAARVSGVLVNVVTNGQSACGHAQISQIYTSEN